MCVRHLNFSTWKRKASKNCTVISAQLSNIVINKQLVDKSTLFLLHLILICCGYVLIVRLLQYMMIVH